MSSDQLNDFITTVHERDLKFTEAISKMAQAQEDTNARLFGGPNQKGALQFLSEKIDGALTEQTEKIALVAKKTERLDSSRKTARAWLAGAVAVLTLEGSALALYLHSVSTNVKLMLGK